MKKRAFAAIIAVVMLFGGCSAQDGQPQERQNQAGGAGNVMQQAAGQNQIAVVSDEIKQSATRVLTGTVQSIVGNEATLLVIRESSGGEDASQSGGHQQRGEAIPGGAATERPQRAGRGEAQRPELSRPTEMDAAPKMQSDMVGQRAQPTEAADESAQQNSASGASLPQDGEDEGKDAAAPEEEQPAPAARQERIETILLPVGMRIGTKDYTTVTAGSTITVYYGRHPDDGSEIITAVELSGGRR